MDEPKLISADSHVNEPGDLWAERIDKGVPPIHLAQGMGVGKRPEPGRCS